jgi:peptidoglycan/LPS O-acetylase OafA/YrhL
MKPHYPILDGLRGTAAILVVIFHLFEAFYPVPANHPMHHGYLAVDFFYLLSGFVVGYAYDDRWAKGLTVKEFFKIRLVRLHPLVILGTVVGAIAFWFDPYTNGAQNVSLLKLIGVMLISFTLMPAPDIRGWNETHPLDGPCWSLLQEYIANIIYALVGRRMSMAALWMVAVISGIALTVTAVYHGDLGTGWGFDNMWIAPIRMLFPFFAGLLLFRTGKLIRLPMAYPLCSLALLVLFCVPTYSFNGYYEAGCIILIFPLIVAAAAGSNINGRWLRLCRFSGAISYPLYLMHYPFIYIYTMWVAKLKSTHEQVIPVVGGLFVFFILLAWAALKWYDEPVRAYLKKRFLSERVG